MEDQRIVVVGGLARRWIIEAEEIPDFGVSIETAKPFGSHTGGRGAFTAVTIHRLSHIKPSDESLQSHESTFQNMTINVYLVAMVGKDEIGGNLKERMIKCGVNSDQVQDVEGSSNRAIVVVDPVTKDHRTWFDNVANRQLGPEFFSKRGSLIDFAGGKKPALLITNLELQKETREQLIKTAEQDGVQVLLNVVPSGRVTRHILMKITHFVIHKAEAIRSYEDCPTDHQPPSSWAPIAEQIILNGAKNVVIILGAQGAYYANKFGAKGFVPCNGSENIGNKVCGGELFIGAYAVEYVRQVVSGQCDKKGEWDIKDAVERGCKASDHKLERDGCTDGCIYPLPWANEIAE